MSSRDGVIRTGLSDLLGFSYMTICSAYRVRPEKGKNISSSSLGENALLMSEVIIEAAAEDHIRWRRSPCRALLSLTNYYHRSMPSLMAFGCLTSNL